MNNKQKAFGSLRLKRVSVVIQYKSNPDHLVAGYALSHEILQNQISFFAPEKFPIDEELTVFFNQNGEKKSATVTMKHMHEQISSGKIMNSLPDEEKPFPALKFYRCYTYVVGAKAAEITSDATADASVSNTPVAVEAVASEVPVSKVIDAFSPDEIASSAIPEVGDIAPADFPMDDLKVA